MDAVLFASKLSNESPVRSLLTSMKRDNELKDMWEHSALKFREIGQL